MKVLSFILVMLCFIPISASAENDHAKQTGTHVAAKIDQNNACLSDSQKGGHDISPNKNINTINSVSDGSSVKDHGLGSLVGHDQKDQNTIEGHINDVKLSTGTKTTVDVHGDDLIHLQTDTSKADVKTSSACQGDHEHVDMTVHDIKQTLDNLPSKGDAVQAKSVSTDNNGDIRLHEGDNVPDVTSPSISNGDPESANVNNTPVINNTTTTPRNAGSTLNVNPVVDLAENTTNNNVVAPIPVTINDSNLQLQTPSTHSKINLPTNPATTLSATDNGQNGLIVVGQVVKLNGDVTEVDQNGQHHQLVVGENVHLGSKYVAQTSSDAVAVVKYFNGEEENVLK